MTRSTQPVQPQKPVQTPQLSDGEMRAVIGQNQPWLDRDEIFSAASYEQLRQRLWNGG